MSDNEFELKGLFGREGFGGVSLLLGI